MVGPWALQGCRNWANLLSFLAVHREPGCATAKQPRGDRHGHAAHQGECGQDCPSQCGHPAPSQCGQPAPSPSPSKSQFLDLSSTCTCSFVLPQSCPPAYSQLCVGLSLSVPAGEAHCGTVLLEAQAACVRVLGVSSEKVSAAWESGCCLVKVGAKWHCANGSAE